MMKFYHVLYVALLLFLVLSSCVDNGHTDNSADTQPPVESPADPFEINQKLGKGVNLGNAFEAPNEGDWGMVVEEEYIELIHRAGFDAVRIPIRWNAHAENTSPFRIDPPFFDRIDEVVNWVLERDMMAVINIHHYNELMEQPGQHRERFISIWEHIAKHYQEYPNTLLFEVLNEPHGDLGPESWNVFLKDAVDIIRESNPNRTLVIGTAPWGGFDGLEDLTLPDSERNIIVTVHYYNPFQFTHQGADWAGDEADEWLGTTWTGTDEQIADVYEDFNRVKKWAFEHNRPIHLGEFGAYSAAPQESREIWTDYVRRAAEESKFSWAYWEFGSGFGIYDRDTNEWRDGLLESLLPNSPELE